MSRDISELARRSVQRSGCQRWRRSGPLLLLLNGVWVVLLGCSGDTTGPTPLPAQQTFWAVRLNYHAVLLALTPPYDTVRLTATALTATGTQLAGMDSIVRYSSPDSSVTVDSTGLVTAHSLIGSTQVIASLTERGVTNKDTVVIQVTPTPFAAPLNAFSIQPKPDGLDSAKMAVDGRSQGFVSGIIPVYATIATGAAATDTVCNVVNCNLLVYFSSSNPAIAFFAESPNIGLIKPLFPGHVTLYASTYAYGVFRQDSIPFTIGYRLVTDIGVAVNSSNNPIIPGIFLPDSILLGTGGQVSFQPFNINGSEGPQYTVIFDRAAGIVGGILGQPGDSVVIVCDTCSDGGNYGSRNLTVPGRYSYQSNSFMNHGIIEVSSGP